jgi:hypothetical protein
MIDFITYLEGKTPVVYHVTFYRNLDSISDIGLDYNEFGGANFQKTHLIQNSRNGNFFTPDLKQVANWVDTLTQNANDRSDDIYEDGLIPIVLKFTVNRNTFTPDQHSEYPKSYYTKKIIHPANIQVWNGSNWVSINDWGSIDLSKFVDWEDRYGYYEITNPYPLPN